MDDENGPPTSLVTAFSQKPKWLASITSGTGKVGKGGGDHLIIIIMELECKADSSASGVSVNRNDCMRNANLLHQSWWQTKTISQPFGGGEGPDSVKSVSVRNEASAHWSQKQYEGTEVGFMHHTVPSVALRES